MPSLPTRALDTLLVDAVTTLDTIRDLLRGAGISNGGGVDWPPDICVTILTLHPDWVGLGLEWARSVLSVSSLDDSVSRRNGPPRPGITTVWGWLKSDARRLMLVYTPQQARPRIARSVAAGAGSPASYANIAACGVPPEFDYASYVIALCCQYATPRLCLHLRGAGARCRGWNPNMVADGGLFTTTSPTHVPEPASFVAHTMDYARGLLAGGELGGGGGQDSPLEGHYARINQWVVGQGPAPGQPAQGPDGQPGPADPGPNVDPDPGVDPELGSPPGGAPCIDPGPGQNIGYSPASAAGCPHTIPRMPGHVPVPDEPSAMRRDWSAVDHIPSEVMFVNPLSTRKHIPAAFAVQWAEIVTTIITRYLSQTDPIEKTRALKYFQLLPSLLLRIDPLRGGRRSRAGAPSLSERFAKWERGDWHLLVFDLLRDVALAATRPVRSGSPTPERRKIQALALIRAGFLSKAVKTLLQTGLADPSVAAVLQQLQKKNPPRRSPIQERSAYGEFTTPPLDLTETLRSLPREKGCGVNGWRNEHLIVCAHEHDSPLAATCSKALGKLGDLLASGSLPAWYYYVESAIKQLAPHKPTSTPDNLAVRPLSLGSVVSRAVAQARVKRITALVSDYVAPHQLAVGLSGGGGALVLASRLLHESQPGGCHAKADLENFHNSFDRDRALAELAECDLPIANELFNLAYCTLLYEAPVLFTYSGTSIAPYRCSSGAGQGHPLAPILAAIILRKHLRRLHQSLDVVGAVAPGLVLAQSDDVHVFGDPPLVHAALHTFSVEVEQDLGVRSNPDKFEVYSPAGDLSLFTGYKRPCTPDGSFGIVANGIPMGGEGFIKHEMQRKVDLACSDIEKIISPLRFEAPQQLLALLQYCIRPLLDHWVRLMLPATVLPFAQQFDDRIAELASEIIHPDLTVGSHAMRRARFPPRLFGLNLRSTVVTAPAAFLAFTSQAAHLLLNEVNSATGAVIPGIAHAQFAPILGNADRDTFWDAFLASGLPSAVAFQTAHAGLVAQLPAGGLDSDSYESHPLSAPISVFGASVAKLQNRVTKQLELIRFAEMRAEINGLDRNDHTRITFSALGKLSTVLTTPVIANECELEPDQFREVLALFLALPSPALSNYVGTELKQPRGRVLVIDQFGYQLCGAVMKGDGWRTRHDTIKLTLDTILIAMGLDVTTEVYDLFSSTLSAAQKQTLDSVNRRRRQGMIPDFLIGMPNAIRHLFELKAINLCQSRYSDARVNACERRAGSIPNEYVKHAQELDRKHLDTPAGEVGPVEAKLRSFGAVNPLVVGPFNDCSDGVEKLISMAAEQGSLRLWRSLGARTPAAAKGYLAWKIRRHLGFASFRAQARLILDRVPQLHGGFSAASNRRSAQRAAFFQRDPAQARTDYEQGHANHNSW